MSNEVVEETTSSDSASEVEVVPEHLSASSSSSTQDQTKRKHSGRLSSSSSKRLRQNSGTTTDEESVPTVSTSEHEEDEVVKPFDVTEWLRNYKKKFRGNKHISQSHAFGLHVLYGSPKTYQFTRTILHLPSKDVINKYRINLSPTLDDRVFRCLEIKLKTLPPTAKYCALCVNEMPLKQNLYYNEATDEVIGYVSINGKTSCNVARVACIITLQGIVINWFQPISYALLANDGYNENIGSWIDEAITKLTAIGFVVKVINSNEHDRYQKYASEIKSITIDKPYFELNKNKIYYIYDIPNLLTSIRDDLVQNDFHFDNYKVSWDYIRDLFACGKPSATNLIPKINKTHIAPNEIHKTKLKYAAEIFSRTVSAALNVYIDLSKISDRARITADFLETMNDLFDMLNSYGRDKRYKYQRSFSNQGYQKAILCESATMFSKIKCINKATGLDNTEEIQSFKHIQISMKSLQMLYQDLKNEGIHYILTRRLNQDCLKYSFHHIKREYTQYNELTAMQFKKGFEKLFINKMMSRSPDSEFINAIFNTLYQPRSVIESVGLTNQVRISGNRNNLFESSEMNVVNYIAGYLLYKLNKKHRCATLARIMAIPPDPDDPYNLFRMYQSIDQNNFWGKVPERFLIYVKELEFTFRSCFVEGSMKNPGIFIYERLKVVPPQVPCTCFPIDYLLKTFTKFRIQNALPHICDKIIDLINSGHIIIISSE